MRGRQVLTHENIGGGSQCGALRYTIAGAVDDASICHCRNSQKAIGTWDLAPADV